jgi:2'-5' RNA ligase
MSRLFFALPAEPMAREAIAAIATDTARRHGGRAMPASKIHLTLAFLGEVDDDRIDLALESAQGLEACAFKLSLDRLGCFARQALAWVAPGQIPDALTRLHDELAGRLRYAGFVLERRRFSPHITIVRRIERPVAPAAMPAVTWRVRELLLVESDLPAGTYRDVARWALPETNEGNRAS